MKFNFLENAIYGFALRGTGYLLYRLKNIDCCYLVFPNNLDMYLDMLTHDQPSYILGLGSYLGIDQNKILINTKTKSFLSPNHMMEFTSITSNSYSNLVSNEIMRLIKKQELKSQYTFLDIPKTLAPWIAEKEIDDALQNFKNGQRFG